MKLQPPTYSKNNYINQFKECFNKANEDSTYAYSEIPILTGLDNPHQLLLLNQVTGLELFIEKLYKSFKKYSDGNGKISSDIKSKIDKVRKKNYEYESKRHIISEIGYDIEEETISISSFYYPTSKAINGTNISRVVDLGCAGAIQSILFNQYKGYDMYLYGYVKNRKNQKQVSHQQIRNVYNHYYKSINCFPIQAVLPEQFNKIKSLNWNNTLIMSHLCNGYFNIGNLNQILSKGRYFITNNLTQKVPNNMISFHIFKDIYLVYRIV